MGCWQCIPTFKTKHATHEVFLVSFMSMQKIALLVGLFWLLQPLGAQQVSTDPQAYKKLGASLKLLLAEKEPKSVFLKMENGRPWLSVLVETDAAIPAAILLKNGIRIRSSFGQIHTADLPLDQCLTAAAQPGIRKIELPLEFYKTDTSLHKTTGAAPTLAGNRPLTRAYTGKNVVMGIIDDGLDITHPSFLDSNGHSRVIGYWNMDKAGTPPQGFSYGHYFSQDSVNHYIKRFETVLRNRYEKEKLIGYTWHGTPVAGIAAGKNGMAPHAQLAIVALTAFEDTVLRSDRLLDAIKFIYQQAKEKEANCVINISMGTQMGGPHDGKTLVEKAIDHFTTNKPDLFISISAGNNGNSWKHWGGVPIRPDSSYGIFQNSYTAKFYISVPKAYSKSLRISFTDAMLGSNINQPQYQSQFIFAQTPYITFDSIIQSAMPVVLNTQQPNGSGRSEIKLSGGAANDDYDEIWVQVQEFNSSGSDFISHLYRFILKGTGSVHVWYPFFNLHPVFMFNNNPLASDSSFRMTDNEFTTNIPSHAFNVMSVGAFNLRNCYVNISNKIVTSYTKGQLTYFTSHGPTQDGRIKPDLVAPGENVLAPRSRLDDYLGHEFIVDTSWTFFSGTSASSPVVAGASALLWEWNPSLSATQIRQLMLQSAYQDRFTGTTLPNNISGHGKLDVFKAITSQPGYDPQWLTSPDICQTTQVISNDTIVPVPEPEVWQVFPNPFTTNLNIRYKSSQAFSVKLYDAGGRMVYSTGLAAQTFVATRRLTLPHYLAPGVYMLVIQWPQKRMVYKLIRAPHAP